MDDARAMRVVERVAISIAIVSASIERQRPFGQALGERLAFEILHDEEVDAVLLDRRRRACRCADG